MTTYKIIESPPYDKDAPNTYWIKREFKLFGFTFSCGVIGDYKMDDDYGYMGQMPFFDRESATARFRSLTAKKRLEILKE